MRKTRTKELKSLREQNSLENDVFAFIRKVLAKVEFPYWSTSFEAIWLGIIVINPLVYDVFDYFVKYMMRYIAFCPQKMHIDAAWAG